LLYNFKVTHLQYGTDRALVHLKHTTRKGLKLWSALFSNNTKITS